MSSSLILDKCTPKILMVDKSSREKSLSLTASIELFEIRSKLNLFAKSFLSNLYLFPDRAPEPKGMLLALFLVS